MWVNLHMPRISGIIAFQTKRSNLERDLRKETDIKWVTKGNRKIPRSIFESISLSIISQSFKVMLKAPAKRSQHVNATYRNIVGRNMLRAFGHLLPCVATCWVLFGLGLKMVKFGPPTPNMLPQGGQTHSTCCAQQCCDILRWHVSIVWPDPRNRALNKCRLRLKGNKQTCCLNSFRMISSGDQQETNKRNQTCFPCIEQLQEGEHSGNWGRYFVGLSKRFLQFSLRNFCWRLWR